MCPFNCEFELYCCWKPARDKKKEKNHAEARLQDTCTLFYLLRLADDQRHGEEDGEGGEAGDVEHLHCRAMVQLGVVLDEG